MRLSNNHKQQMRQQARNISAADEATVLENYQAAALTARARGAAQALLDDLNTLWRMLTDAEYSLPWWVWAWIVVALLYFVNPFDLIPDALPVVGYLDDATVLGWVMTLINEEVVNYRRGRGG